MKTFLFSALVLSVAVLATLFSGCEQKAAYHPSKEQADLPSPTPSVNPDTSTPSPVPNVTP